MSETPHPHAVFWIDLEKITPNPFQPRKYFDPARLQDLSDSIRRYGVLQPIVVTRTEERTPDGGMVAKYEIIAGERRFRASKIAGLEKIPAIIREGEQTDKEKLELAILENLQREDLSPVDKARSFNQLVVEFGLKHAEVAEHLGKSREYVSNSLRLLQLPDYILDALSEGKISEGHTRPLLMLKERPEEQQTLFTQMTSIQGMTVRAAEKFARSIATEKQRKNKELDPEMKEIEQKLASHLGAKVSIDKKSQGGKLTIEFGNKDDLRQLFEKIQEEAPDVFTQQMQEKSNPYFAPAPVEEKPIVNPIIEPVSEEIIINPGFVSAHASEPRVVASDLQNELEPIVQVDSQHLVKPQPQQVQQPMIQPQQEVGVSDLQREIDALAQKTIIDEPETQSQYSYNNVATPVERSQEVQIPAQETDSKFTFHADSVNEVSQPESNANVGIVSEGSLETFARVEHSEVVKNVDSVALGSNFIPQGNPEVKQWGTINPEPVQPDLKKNDDEDLYRLDNFSV